jgi:hypothetical protein
MQNMTDFFLGRNIFANMQKVCIPLDLIGAEIIAEEEVHSS